MSNTYIGHSKQIKCEVCGYVDTGDAFKNGCPYCEDKGNQQVSKR